MDMALVKALPEPKGRNLIPPDMDHLYFEGAKEYPLKPKATAYVPANAWWFAEFALLAYCHPGFARMAYRLVGFDGFQFFGGVGTECMVSWNRRAVIVAFRGTELKSSSSLHEIRTDLNAVPVAFDMGGKVHKGFLDGLEEIWGGPEGLQALLEERLREAPHRPVWMTGHSLGGALAALCFARTPQATGLYLYGSPRVGNHAFVELFEERAVWRIENACDPVPLVPPDLPLLHFRFGDLGQLKFLSSRDEVLESRPLLVLSDHHARYRAAKSELDDKLRELGASLFSRGEGRSAKQIGDEIGAHVELTRREWRHQLDGCFKEFGLSVDQHQPIYYAIKTWNALVGKS